MDDAYDLTLDAILDLTRRKGGLAITIADARRFVADAKVDGIDETVKRYPPSFGPFVERLLAEVSAVRKARNFEPEEPEPALPPEEQEGLAESPLEDLTVEQLRAEGQRFKIRNRHLQKRENLIKALRELRYETAAEEST